MSQIAHEVSRRMTPAYARERAREMARERMGRARDRAVENAWFMPLVGAGVGALVARALQSRSQDRGFGRERGYRGAYEPYGTEYDAYVVEGSLEADVVGREEPEAGGGSSSTERARARAAEMGEGARAKAGEMGERVRHAAASARERMPDRDRLRRSARDDAGLWALGAMGLGALFGLAIPETRREREMMGPARRRARELGTQAAQAAVEKAKHVAVEKGAEALDAAREKVSGGEDERERPQPGSAPPGGPPGPVDPLH